MKYIGWERKPHCAMKRSRHQYHQSGLGRGAINQAREIVTSYKDHKQTGANYNGKYKPIHDLKPTRCENLILLLYQRKF